MKWLVLGNVFFLWNAHLSCFSHILGGYQLGITGLNKNKYIINVIRKNLNIKIKVLWGLYKYEVFKGRFKQILEIRKRGGKKTQNESKAIYWSYY